MKIHRVVLIYVFTGWFLIYENPQSVLIYVTTGWSLIYANPQLYVVFRSILFYGEGTYN